MRELGSKVIGGEFLDNHMMGDLEDEIWQWLNEEFGVFQGEMAEQGLALKIILIQEGRS